MEDAKKVLSDASKKNGKYVPPEEIVLTKPSANLMQFLLDASVLPETQHLVRTTGVAVLYQIFSLTRTWCYSIHRERLKVINSLKED